MHRLRKRARLLAAVALTWLVIAVAAVSTVLSCDLSAVTADAGTPDCPLHRSAPACPKHAEKHGTHECDCPTIGCSQTDTDLIPLLGAIGVLPDSAHPAVPLDAGPAPVRVLESVSPLALAPLAPPPRA